MNNTPYVPNNNNNNNIPLLPYLKIKLKYLIEEGIKIILIMPLSHILSR
ncbi:MAG: hypothetical protein O7D30_08160 [Rickettsia endosymbiont of Ixodes persulcatus]|nr:hypothetical protein [Rickettsia endosymbiont of Ixodes persulcatus]